MADTMTGTVEEAVEQMHDLRRCYALALHDALFELQAAGRVEAAERCWKRLRLIQEPRRLKAQRRHYRNNYARYEKGLR